MKCNEYFVFIYYFYAAGISFFEAARQRCAHKKEKLNMLRLSKSVCVCCNMKYSGRFGGVEALARVFLLIETVDSICVRP